MKISKAYDILRTIKKDISKLKNQNGDFLYSNKLQYNIENKNEVFHATMLDEVLHKLEDVYHLLTYMERDILIEGRVVKDNKKGYIVKGIEYYPLSIGSIIEYLDPTEKVWKKSHIHSHQNNYFIAALGKDITIENLYIRIREK